MPNFEATTRPNLSARVAWWVAAMLGLILAAGCERKEYARGTPEELLASARAMVEKGRADKLTELVYADSEDMRLLLRRMGRALGSVQELATEIQQRYPDEVRRLRDQATAPGSQVGLSQLMRQMRGGGRRGLSIADRDKRNQQFGDAIKTILVDPYAWLQDNAGRLTTVPLNDNSVALQWDGKPVLPPIGMVLRKDDGVWSFVLPTNIPVLAQFLPQTPDEYKTFGVLFRIMENAMRDVTREIREGKLKDLSDVSQKAGENMFIPAAIFMMSYSKVIEERQERARQGASESQPAPAPAPGNEKGKG